MQFSPNNKYCSIAQYYHGVFPYVRRIISRVERDDSHPYAHWNVDMKNYWRHFMYHKIGLITDYKNSIDNYKEPCELPTNTILIVGCDDNSNIQVRGFIPLEATPRQSNHAIV